MHLNNKIREYTDHLEQKGLLRNRVASTLKNSSLIHFDSNDYLSLTQDKRIAKAYQQGYERFPSGSGASMLLSGYHDNHRAVERAFSELLAVDDCILFSSGYAANLAVSGLLGQLKSNCIIDKSVHASVYDGLNLAQVRFKRYLHNNLNHLCQVIKSGPDPSVLITEGIFSMSGQIAPLSAISSLCVDSKIDLIVDEAHSFGVLGTNGRGATNFHGLTQNEVPLRVIPLGKAYAAQGALVAGQKEWIDALLQAGRSIIYSTAMSPAFSYGLLKTLDIVVASDERRSKIMELIQNFRECIRLSSLQWVDSITPIQQLQLGCPHLALYYSQELIKRGFVCSAIRAPTVTTKATGLRIILNFNHTPMQIEQLFNELNVIYEHTSN